MNPYSIRVKFFILCFIVLLPAGILAQESIPDLVTDRPDQTESSSVVQLKCIQIESGFIFESDTRNYEDEQVFTWNTSLIRIGILDNFELRIGLEYLEQNITRPVGPASNPSGLSPLYTGFKAKILEEKGWIPEIAFLGGLVFPFTAVADFKPDYTASTFRFAFSHTLSDNLSLGYNIGAEWDGETTVPGYFYSLALGYTLNNSLGIFAESYGLLYGNGGSEHMIDAGMTYLLLPALQVDISGGLGITNTAIDYFVSCGISYRIHL